MHELEELDPRAVVPRHERHLRPHTNANTQKNLMNGQEGASNQTESDKQMEGSEESSSGQSVIGLLAGDRHGRKWKKGGSSRLAYLFGSGHFSSPRAISCSGNNGVSFPYQSRLCVCACMIKNDWSSPVRGVVRVRPPPWPSAQAPTAAGRLQ